MSDLTTRQRILAARASIGLLSAMVEKTGFEPRKDESGNPVFVIEAPKWQYEDPPPPRITPKQYGQALRPKAKKGKKK